MVDKSNQREDKEVKTERPGTETRHQERWIHKNNEVDKISCRGAKIGRSRRVYSEFNSKNGS